MTLRSVLRVVDRLGSVALWSAERSNPGIECGDRVRVCVSDWEGELGTVVDVWRRDDGTHIASVEFEGLQEAVSFPVSDLEASQSR
jgi:hypothetical protein